MVSSLISASSALLTNTKNLLPNSLWSQSWLTNKNYQAYSQWQSFGIENIKRTSEIKETMLAREGVIPWSLSTIYFKKIPGPPSLPPAPGLTWLRLKVMMLLSSYSRMLMVSNAHVLSASSPDLRDIITRHASGVPEINLHVVHPPCPGWQEAPHPRAGSLVRLLWREHMVRGTSHLGQDTHLPLMASRLA